MSKGHNLSAKLALACSSKGTWHVRFLCAAAAALRSKQVGLDPGPSFVRVLQVRRLPHTLARGGHGRFRITHTTKVRRRACIVSVVQICSCSRSSTACICTGMQRQKLLPTYQVQHLTPYKPGPNVGATCCSVLGPLHAIQCRPKCLKTVQGYFSMSRKSIGPDTRVRGQLMELAAQHARSAQVILRDGQPAGVFPCQPVAQPNQQPHTR